MQKVLITDDLFINGADVAALELAGFAVERLLPQPGDEGLIKDEALVSALGDKDGYILGGLERVSQPILDAAPKLQAIAFTGSGFSEFIPAYKLASERGILIANSGDANATAVARFTKALILQHSRKLTELQVPGSGFFQTVSDYEDQTVVVMGYGHIGRRVAHSLRSEGFKVRVCVRSGTTPIVDGFELVSADDIGSVADIVTVHVDNLGGRDALSAGLVNSLKNGTLVVNCSFPGAVNESSLFQRLINNELYAAFDSGLHDKSLKIEELPSDRYRASGIQAAFNTRRANRLVSENAVQAMISMLKDGDSKLVVNKRWLVK